jgi:uncharacterized membrane protein YtjA (UPF0391 family)
MVEDVAMVTAWIFFIIAVIAAILGFGVDAVTFASLAKLVFYGAAVLFFTSLMGVWVRGSSSQWR